MTEFHPLCCDCDSCINGSGGYVLPSAGATVPTPGDRARRRWLPLNQQLALALQREEQARQSRDHYRNVVRELSTQGGGR